MPTLIGFGLMVLLCLICIIKCLKMENEKKCFVFVDKSNKEAYPIFTNSYEEAERKLKSELIEGNQVDSDNIDFYFKSFIYLDKMMNKEGKYIYHSKGIL